MCLDLSVDPDLESRGLRTKSEAGEMVVRVDLKTPSTILVPHFVLYRITGERRRGTTGLSLTPRPNPPDTP